VLYVSASLSKWSVSVIVGPIAKGRGPRLLAFWGEWGQAGARGGVSYMAPSGDGETGNTAARSSFRRLFEIDWRRSPRWP
jgi:hypothetical protein